MPVRLVFVLVFAAGLLAGCNDDGSYASFESDDDYPLSSMLLSEDDVPAGWSVTGSTSQQAGDGPEIGLEVDNDLAAEVWVDALEPDQDAARAALLRQLEAQGRVRGYIVQFVRDDPAAEYASYQVIWAQSTLFKDEQAAREALRAFCDLQQYRTANALRDLTVPAISDGSVAFEVTQLDPDTGLASRDTVICFRAGRVVSAVATGGLAGSEDFGATYRFATRLAARVDAAYETAGSAPAEDADNS